MKGCELLRGAALACVVTLSSVACSGENEQAEPNNSASESTTPTTASGAPPKAAEVFTLVSVQAGDAACYLSVKDSNGAEQSLPADFDLCPGGTSDATAQVGRKVTLERRPGQVMADSCSGDPNCTATKTVDLVIAIKPASTSATTAAASAALVGQTDTNPAHWAPATYERPQRIQQRIHGDDPPTLVNDFPVTMNGCDTRQLRVKWRSVDSPVAAGIADYADATTPPPEVTQQQPPTLQGTMTLGGCEQPAYRGSANIVVEVTVYEPAA
jgi:hypothetical protein